MTFGNFSRDEFACKCGCGYDPIDAELLAVLQDLRDTFSSAVHITSGCRCKEYNKRIGGSTGSQHILGKAADIWVKDTKPEDVHEYLIEKYDGKYGIGLYNSWVHVDVRNGPARWKS